MSRSCGSCLPFRPLNETELTYLKAMSSLARMLSMSDSVKLVVLRGTTGVKLALMAYNHELVLPFRCKERAVLNSPQSPVRSDAGSSWPAGWTSPCFLAALAG